MLKNILAIETSAAICSVALSSRGQIYSRSKPAQREQSQLLLPMIDGLLNEAKYELADLDLIALAIGPGSFTGIRLAISAAQGLSISLDLPVLGISSLQNLAQGIYELYQHDKIIVCVNAYMGQVYYATYQIKNHIATLDSTESLLNPLKLSLPDDLEDWVGVGNGWLDYQDIIPKKPLTSYTDYLPKAETLIKLSNSAALQASICRSHELNPAYLRDADAWQKKA